MALAVPAATHAAPAHPSTAHPQPLLVVGSHGQRVKDLQWLLAGHRPSAYKLDTFHHKPNGLFGRRTAAAVVQMKYRLGFPDSALKPAAGAPLREILLGHEARPVSYITRATARLHKVTKPAPPAPIVARIRKVAESQLGVHEVPWGSNDGPQVRQYQAVTGQFHAPWCVSFAQWVYLRAGAGTFADRTAGVFYAVDWARSHGDLRSMPKPGVLVAFLDRLGHMGVVESVSLHGFTSIEGNASDSVLRRFHPLGERPEAFIYLPEVAK